MINQIVNIKANFSESNFTVYFIINLIVETMKAGCINKKTGMRDPFMMGWTLHGDDVPKGEKIDEYLNKACLEKELDTGSAVGMKGDPKPFKACFCDTPLCNSGNLPGICGMTLFLIGLISKLF